MVKNGKQIESALSFKGSGEKHATMTTSDNCCFRRELIGWKKKNKTI